jgi:hypothetical protein
MPSAGPPRRPLDNVPGPARFGMAVLGIVVGLLLVFVGARSCETSLSNPEPTPLTVPAPADAATSN